MTVSKAASNAVAPAAKGDLVIGSGTNASTVLGVASTAGWVLTVDSATSTGLKWAAPSAGSFVGARVSAQSSISTNTATWTTVGWDAEYYDTDAFHSTSVNNSRMTIPSGKGGYYAITVLTAPFLNGTGIRDIRIQKNGTTIYYGDQKAGSASVYETIGLYVVVNLAVNDYIEVQVHQTSGGSLNWYIDTNAGYPQFGVEYLGA